MQEYKPIIFVEKIIQIKHILRMEEICLDNNLIDGRIDDFIKSEYCPI